jgi:2,3-bisphosphoglycerate-independent phosphoglycerate mutase
VFFNFRSDRAQQLSQAILDPAFSGFDREITPRLHYVTLTEYNSAYGVPVVFPPQSLSNILGEVVSKAGLSQLRIAETEKYPHVTYFFNGGVKDAFPGEERVIVPSPQDVATYDLKPQMSAPEVTREVVERLGQHDLVILNFANPDMVGHTGVLEAGIKAVETIDSCVQAVVEKTLALGGRLLITADHGNCEQMRNPDGSPHTAHTTNLVHLLYAAGDAEGFSCKNGILADVAPTRLALLCVEKPAEMTGSSLLVPKSH